MAVHPRIRGERQSPNGTSIFFPGSSPHTRGTRLHLSKEAAQVRFIPAYAGNAVTDTDRETCKTVHPRIRGERHPDKVDGLVLDGSSPHTRGTLVVPVRYYR